MLNKVLLNSSNLNLKDFTQFIHTIPILFVVNFQNIFLINTPKLTLTKIYVTMRILLLYDQD